MKSSVRPSSATQVAISSVFLFLPILGCGSGSGKPGEEWLDFPKYASSTLRAEYEASVRGTKSEKPEAYWNVARLSQEIANQLGRRKSEQQDDFIIQTGVALRRAMELRYPDLPERENIKFVLLNEAAMRCKRGEVDKAISLVENSFAMGVTLDEIEDLDLRDEWKPARDSEGYDKIINEWRNKIAMELLYPVRPVLPFDFEFTDLDGVEHRSADRRGKVSVVNFWGTWCEPCMEELPHLIQLQNEYAETGLQVYGVGHERGTPEANLEAAKAAIEKEGINYPCLLVDLIWLRNYASELDQFPTTLFIDKAGQVRMVSEGDHEFEYFDTVVSILNSEKLEDIQIE